MTILKGHDVNRLEAADQRSLRPPAAERDLQVHLVRSDMDGRTLVPLAPRPAVARPGPEILELVVAVVRPDDDLAARQPHMREIAGRVERCFIAAIETRHVGVEHSHRFLQRIAHPILIGESAVPPVSIRHWPQNDSAAASIRPQSRSRRASVAPRSSAWAMTSSRSGPKAAGPAS